MGVSQHVGYLWGLPIIKITVFWGPILGSAHFGQLPALLPRKI